MKIIYCRKQAQAAVEYVNTHNPMLTTPLNFREVCENVKESFLDLGKRWYGGIYYDFQLVDATTFLCNICVLPVYLSGDDAMYFDIEITDEELFKEELDSLKYFFGEDVQDTGSAFPSIGYDPTNLH